MNTNTEKWINLAKKLKELSERGAENEKESAAEFLHKLMLKHNITKEQIEGNKRETFNFYLPKEIPVKFIFQVLSNCTGSIKEYGLKLGELHSKKRKTRFYTIIDIEPTVYFEFKAKIDFYWNDYNEQLELFYKAYIQKNSLYTKPNENEEETIAPTDKEREELYKIMSMMDGISRAAFHKQIENAK